VGIGLCWAFHNVENNGTAAALLVAISIVEAGIQKRSFGLIVRQGVIAAALCSVAFVLGSPGWLLTPSHMLDGILHEFKMIHYGHLGFTGYPFVGQIELLFEGSPALFVLALFGIGSTDWRNRTDRHAIYLLIAGLLLPALNDKQFTHYIFPAFISLCYFAARFANNLGRWRLAAPVLCGLALAVFVFVNAHALNYLKPHSLTLAREWIEMNVGPNDSIVMDRNWCWRWTHVPRVLTAEDLNSMESSKRYLKSPMLQRYFREHEKPFNLQPLDAYTRSWLDTTSAELRSEGESKLSTTIRVG
jgi:hypothetical protein